MRCEEHVRLLREYFARVRAYTDAVENLKKCTGIPRVEYELAFKLCNAARETTEEAHRLLRRHVSTCR